MTLAVRRRGAGDAGAGGGPAPNTALLTTAYGARHPQSHNIVIPRITADDPNNPNRKVPIVTDRVSVGNRDVVIIGVEHPAGRDFTVLTLESEIGVEVGRGDPVRVDRLKYADVESGTIDGALNGPAGNVQARILVQAPGAQFTATLKTPIDGFLGAGGNGVRLSFEIADSAEGYFYYSPGGRHMYVRRSVQPTIGAFRQFLIDHAGSYLTISALAGNANAALAAVSWQFANGVSTTLGETQLALHNVRENIRVGDSIQFSAQAGGPRRTITEVTHDAAKTTLTFGPNISFAYANDAALVIERPSGYAQSVVSVAGPRGLIGPSAAEASARSRIFRLADHDPTDRVPLALNLDEAIEDGADYQIEVVDSGNRMGAVSPDIAGETIRGKKAFAAAPANLSDMITSWLVIRFNNTALAQGAVARFYLFRGATDRQLYLMADSWSQGDELGIEVYKYPRTGPKGPAGPGVAVEQDWPIVGAFSAAAALTQAEADAAFDVTAANVNLVEFGAQPLATLSFVCIGVPVTSPDITSLVDQRSGTEMLGSTNWGIESAEYQLGINGPAGVAYKWLKTKAARGRNTRNNLPLRVFQGTRIYGR